MYSQKFSVERIDFRLDFVAFGLRICFVVTAFQIFNLLVVCVGGVFQTVAVFDDFNAVFFVKLEKICNAVRVDSGVEFRVDEYRRRLFGQLKKSVRKFDIADNLGDTVGYCGNFVGCQVRVLAP